ncbi:MAG: RagB/SusD family nutrient uptake outer membrane protein, partial [Chitinophagaceae bacterium]
MKNIFKKTGGMLCLLLTLTMIGCNKQLNQQPLDRFATTEFWTTEDNAYLALVAIYRGNIFTNAPEYTPNDWWGSTGLNWLEMATDNAYPRTGDAGVQNKLTNGTLTSNIGILGNYWSNSYSRIAHCNDFLEHIGSVNMNEARRARMIAEVKFIRASQYFYLSQYFGSAPLIIKVLTPQEANVVTKATHQQLVDFVLAEYTAALPALPRQKDLVTSEIGRASKQACLAFLGRLQLAEGKFADAAISYKTIIDFGDNIIDPNYQSIFLEANENSSENIFSTQYVPNLLGNPL